MSKETHEEFMNRVEEATRRPGIKERVEEAIKCQCDGKDKKCKYCQSCKSKEVKTHYALSELDDGGKR